MIHVICNPTIDEIQEMLDCIALTQDMDKYFPMPADMSRAEHLHNGVCLLFYDEDYRPLSYCAFIYEKPNENPFFCPMVTKFCTWQHMFLIRKAMIRVFDSEFKRGVRVYITNKAVLSFARACGFVQSKRNKKIYYRRRYGRR